MKKIIFLLLSLCLIMLLSNAIAITEEVSIDFTDIKTRDLLKLLAERTNKNIVISEKIKGKVTVNLKKVSWIKALDVVLKMAGLTRHEVDGVLIILTPEEIEKNKGSILESHVFNLQYISAEKVVGLLKQAGVLSQHGKLGVDSKNNSLIVTDTVSKAKAVKSLINKIDLPAERILIEARIVSADEAFLRELGIELHARRTNLLHGLKKKAKDLSLNHGQFNFAIANMGNSNLLDLQLAALEDKGRGRVISRPKLLTMDRQSAYIESGAEIPYQEKTKEGNTSVSFKKAVLSLKVTPEIAAKNKINLDLNLNQDKVGQLLMDGVPTIAMAFT